MSEDIGSSLPPPLQFELGAHPRGEHVNATLLLTADTDGLQRVAVLAPAEIAVRDAIHIAIKVHPTSSTCANLKRAGQAALWYVLDAAAYCIRGSVLRALTKNADKGFETFEMTITSVLRDFYPDAPMVCGPRYKKLV